MINHQISGLLQKDFNLSSHSRLHTSLRVLGPAIAVLLARLLTHLSAQFQVPAQPPSILNLPGYYSLAAGPAYDCSSFYLLQTDDINYAEYLNRGWPSLRCQDHIFRVSADGRRQVVEALGEIAGGGVEDGEVEGVGRLADGVVRVHRRGHFTISVNDHRMPEYHRNNGLTKLIPSLKNTSLFPLLKVSQGLVELQDRIFKAIAAQQGYLVNSAVMGMPESGIRNGYEYVGDLAAVVMLAVAFGMGLPMCLESLVYQKQHKHLQFMTVNGLRLEHYKQAYLLYQLFITLVQISLFVVVFAVSRSGRLLLEQHLGELVLAISLFCMANVVICLPLSSVISQSKSASILGYSLTIWPVLISLPLNTLLYPYPSAMPVLTYCSPALLFFRACNLLIASSALNSPSDQYREEFVLCLAGICGWALAAGCVGFWGCKEGGKDEGFWVDQEGGVACRDVHFWQGNGQHVLKGITLDVGNQIYGLLGPNGAGKSTFFSVLLGQKRQQRGEISLFGNKIGYCPQHDITYPELTITQHLQLFQSINGHPRNRIAIQACIDSVRLTEHSQKRVKQLSGGMRRRLMIAIACVGEPGVLLLDEPSVGLDPANKRALWEVIANSQRGRTVILTTHSMQEADHLCTRIGLLSKGRIVFEGSSQQLKQRFSPNPCLSFNFQSEGLLDSLLLKLRRDHQVTVKERYSSQAIVQLGGDGGRVRVGPVLKIVRESGVKEWRVGMASLEEAYLRAIDQADM